MGPFLDLLDCLLDDEEGRVAFVRPHGSQEHDLVGIVADVLAPGDEATPDGGLALQQALQGAVRIRVSGRLIGEVGKAEDDEDLAGEQLIDQQGGDVPQSEERAAGPWPL